MIRENPKEYLLHLESERLKTFKDWPFRSSCKCTPQKLAKAGFYHIPSDNEPDAVRCFFCFKELDGWEPDDEPIEEHRSHSPHCKFLTLTTPVEDMTTQQLLQFEMLREKNKVKIMINSMKEKFEQTYKHVRLEMEKLAN